MNYSLIRPCDIANGPGVRVSLFVSGCTHYCPGCFQPETWDFNYGKKFTDETIWEILRLLEPNYIDGLTVLGGEPLDQRNMDDVWALLDVVRRMGAPEKTVWLYTGSTLEFLNARPYKYGRLTKSILNKVDILVDGPFVEAKKDLRLKFCGSSNQRLIDLRKTKEACKIVLWEGEA